MSLTKVKTEQCVIACTCTPNDWGFLDKRGQHRGELLAATHTQFHFPHPCWLPLRDCVRHFLLSSFHSDFDATNSTFRLPPLPWMMSQAHR